MSQGDFRDYFSLLGVERSATADEVKTAFRRMARKYHPDINPGDKNAESKFKEINEAYEVLSDPKKRRKYEQFGQYWNKSSGIGGGSAFDVDFGGYANFDEFINDLLGKFGASPGGVGSTAFSRNSSRVPINLDAKITLTISFKEAFQGTERILSVDQERVHVRIPKGMRSGSKLRVKGKGNLQPGVGRRGDLYITIEVEQHPIWMFDGDKLCAELPIALDELLLGETVTAMTPDGEAQIQIPAGTLPGKSLRLKEKGWPSINGRGDLILTLKLQLPNQWTAKEVNLLKKLRGMREKNPRQNWLKSAKL